jgi:SPP1 family predicted phage head-tail adaptor
MLKGRDKIGTLDREITFVKPIIENGVSNEDKITGWEEIDSYPRVTARKIEQDGSTLVQSDRISFSQQTTWVIRYRDDLNVRMRLIWDTKAYEILNISEADEGRKRYLNIATQFLDNEYFT